MPKRRKPAPDWPAPIQLPLFAETASLVRVRPALREWRYYRMEISFQPWPSSEVRRTAADPTKSYNA
jgi:hypothetical protein